MTVTITARTVSYAIHSGSGTAVTVIDLSLPTPRTMSYLLLSDGSIDPSFVFLDELLTLIKDARQRLQSQGVTQ